MDICKASEICGKEYVLPICGQLMIQYQGQPTVRGQEDIQENTPAAEAVTKLLGQLTQGTAGSLRTLRLIQKSFSTTARSAT